MVMNNFDNNDGKYQEVWLVLKLKNCKFQYLESTLSNEATDNIFDGIGRNTILDLDAHKELIELVFGEGRVSNGVLKLLRNMSDTLL